MSKSSSRQLEGDITQFCAITGASTKHAKQYLEKYKRLDVAVDAYYSNPPPATPSKPSAGPSTTKINQLFDNYKDDEPVDPTADEISIEGIMQFCEDLGITPDDVVVLVLAYEFKAPRMAEWPRKGWVDGWKSLGVDTIEGLKEALPQLRSRLGNDSDYFTRVYQHTFGFGCDKGARSMAIDTAKALWEIILSAGLSGGALSHITHTEDDEEDEDDTMDSDEEGWSEKHTMWWFDFLTKKGGKGISKDTWHMFQEFVRTIDAKFEKYDPTASWPSTVDEFVEYAKNRIAEGQ